jgi:hypothetical protein
MASKNLKQISGYLYHEQKKELAEVTTKSGTSESKFVREAVLYVLKNPEALAEVSLRCQRVNYRKSSG